MVGNKSEQENTGHRQELLKQMIHFAFQIIDALFLGELVKIGNRTSRSYSSMIGRATIFRLCLTALVSCSLSL